MGNGHAGLPWKAALALSGIALVLIAACADGDSSSPPLAELSLRDALSADPNVVLALAADEKKKLADRLADAETTQKEEESVSIDAGMSPALEVKTIDDARVARELDALVVAEVRVDHGRLVAKTRRAALPAVANGNVLDGGAALPPLPPIEGDPPDTTANDEAKALGGAAGDVVKRLLRDTHAHRVARMTKWPVAAVAIDDVVYVNGAWLVAMAARETSAPNAAASAGGITFVTPQSLRGNPYQLYATLAECVADMTSRCQSCVSSGQCDDHAVLSDFHDGKSECTYLLAPSTLMQPIVDGGLAISRVEELCAMALLDVSSVADCVKKESCAVPTGANTSANLTNADDFISDDRCVRALDLCLSGSNVGLDAGVNLTLVDVKVEGCDDPFKACSAGCSACSSACSSGHCSGQNAGPSCSSCSGCTTCSGCGDSTRTSGGKNSGYGSTGSGNPAPVPTGQTGGTGGGSSGGGSSGGGSSGGGSSGGGSSGGGSSSGGSSSGGSSSSSGSSSSGGGCGGSGGSGSGSNGSSSSGGCGSCGGGSGSGSSGGGCGSCGSSGGGNSCGKCEESTPLRAPGDPPLAPASSLFWLLLPVAYLGARARKSESRERSAS